MRETNGELQPAGQTCDVSVFNSSFFHVGGCLRHIHKHIFASADVKSFISSFQGGTDLQRATCFFSKPCLFRKNLEAKKPHQHSFEPCERRFHLRLHKHNKVATKPHSQSHFAQIYFSNLLLCVLMQLKLQIKTACRPRTAPGTSR